MAESKPMGRPPQGQGDLRETIESYKQTNSYETFESLPSDSAEIHQVRVVDLAYDAQCPQKSPSKFVA